MGEIPVICIIPVHEITDGDRGSVLPKWSTHQSLKSPKCAFFLSFFPNLTFLKNCKNFQSSPSLLGWEGPSPPRPALARLSSCWTSFLCVELCLQTSDLATWDGFDGLTAVGRIAAGDAKYNNNYNNNIKHGSGPNQYRFIAFLQVQYTVKGKTRVGYTCFTVIDSCSSGDEDRSPNSRRSL